MDIILKDGVLQQHSQFTIIHFREIFTTVRHSWNIWLLISLDVHDCSFTQVLYTNVLSSFNILSYIWYRLKIFLPCTYLFGHFLLWGLTFIDENNLFCNSFFSSLRVSDCGFVSFSFLKGSSTPFRRRTVRGIFRSRVLILIRFPCLQYFSWRDWWTDWTKYIGVSQGVVIPSKRTYPSNGQTYLKMGWPVIKDVIGTIH